MFKVSGVRKNGEKFSLVVKSQNGYHAMVLVSKYHVSDVKAMSASKVVA